MFSLKPLSVLRMRMSGLVALRLCVATVPGCCVGVTGTGTQGGVAAALCSVSDPQPPPRALPEQGNSQLQCSKDFFWKMGRVLGYLTSTHPWQPRTQIREWYPELQKAEWMPQRSSKVLEKALCSWLPTSVGCRAEKGGRAQPRVRHVSTRSVHLATCIDQTTHPGQCFHSSLFTLNILLHEGNWLCIYEENKTPTLGAPWPFSKEFAFEHVLPPVAIFTHFLLLHSCKWSRDNTILKTDCCTPENLAFWGTSCSRDSSYSSHSSCLTGKQGRGGYLQSG